MGQRLYGKIVRLHKNYGIIETTIYDHHVKLFFNIVSSMLNDKGEPILCEKVSFLTRKMIWHNVNIVCAYDIRPESGKQIEVSSFIIKGGDFSKSLFASLRPDSIPGKNTLNELINTERQVSLFYLKWILYIEKSTKLALTKAIQLIEKSSSWLISKMEANKSTRKIIKNSLEGLKEKTWLLPMSDFVRFAQKQNDPNDVFVSDAPVELLLSTVTLNELADVLKAVFPELLTIEEKDPNLYIFLWYLEGMLSDLSLIRNSAAHGNIITPLIIDDTFGPAYFYDMADAFPQWNSNESLNNVEKYRAFSFIRYLAKGEAKSGVHLTGLPFYSPQIEALYFTKSLFLNPAKKSMFSMFFLIHAIFSFFDETERDNFYDDLHQSGLSFYEDDKESPFTGFPSKKDSISCRLYRIVWLILKYGDKNSFKCFASICKKITSKNDI